MCINVFVYQCRFKHIWKMFHTDSKYNLYGFSTPLIGGRCWLSQIIASDNTPYFFPHIQTQTEII
jgi:hypothetical protein